MDAWTRSRGHIDAEAARCPYCRHVIERAPGVPIKVRICPHCQGPVSRWLFG